MEERLMDIAQLAEYLQMNKMTIYKLAREGKIPAFKVASEWRFKKELIEEWLMNQLKGKPEFEKFRLTKKTEAEETVLVVDDEKVIRDFFVKALANYRVLVASNGEEALSLIKKEKCDLVLLDLKMPGIDGIGTLRRIKEIDKNIAVVMLSAYGTLETNLEAARLGAYTSIAKPFDLKEMLVVIQSALVSKPEVGETVPVPKARKKKK